MTIKCPCCPSFLSHDVVNCAFRCNGCRFVVSETTLVNMLGDLSRALIQTARAVVAIVDNTSPNVEDECPGLGGCHGSLKWCQSCGDVSHTCDMDVGCCDAHPEPFYPGVTAEFRGAKLRIPHNWRARMIGGNHGFDP